LAPIANAVWLSSQAYEYQHFLRDSANPRAIQNALLKKYVSKNASTDFGLRYEFSKIHSAKEYAQAIPLQDGSTLEHWVLKTAGCNSENSANSESDSASTSRSLINNILCANPITRLEPTSGSTSSAKLIPITSDLRREVNRAVCTWMCSLFREHPRAFWGTAYWSISPPMISPYVLPGSRIPIRHARDSEYLNPFSAWLFRQVMSVPESITGIVDSELFYQKTLSTLLSDSRLSLVSVWSPTFLLQLDERIRNSPESTLRYVADSGMATSQRVCALEKCLRPGFTWKDIWPNLAVVSCWTHAQSTLWIARVREVLGEVPIHAKGLMATEGVTSIPVLPELDPCLAFRSHYYEFLPDGGDIALQTHEVDLGNDYEVILTTGGGLYRYRTGDMVRVTGFFKATPCLQFLGRRGRVSDLVGEKISEVHANQALAKISDSVFVVRGAFLYPELSQGQARYTLYLELGIPNVQITDSAKESFSIKVARIFEASLNENPYYYQAQTLGQLGSLRVKFLDPGTALRLSTFMAMTRGAREGTCKVPVLFRAGELADFLKSEP